MDEDLDIFLDTTAYTTGLEEDVEVEAEERLYDYTNQRETGDASNLYWGNFSKKVTESELRALFNAKDNGQLRAAFGDFDNYLAYMNERQNLIDSGELKADWWNTEQALITPDEVAAGGDMGDKAFEEFIIGRGVTAATGAYQDQSGLLLSLYQQYTGKDGNYHFNNDGDKFEWNGTSYVKTSKVDDHNYGKMVPYLIAAGLSGAAASAIVNSLGITSGFLGGATKGAIGSAISQGITTGSLDPSAIFQSAVLGGVGGFFEDLTTGDLGIIENADGTISYTINGEVMGAAQNFVDTKIQQLSDLLGIDYNGAAGIVEGVVKGTITGEDLEGIAINATAGWSKAKIDSWLNDTLGPQGVDIDNFFREGTTNISTEALQGLAGRFVDTLVDGGLSNKDALLTIYDYFEDGGSLDFILPGLLDLDVDIDWGEGFDVCATMPKLCNWDFDIECPKWLKDKDGKCLNVDIEVPEINCPEGKEYNTELGKCVDIDIFEINCPEGKEYNTELGKCVDIDIFEINCPEGKEYNTELGKCVDIEIPEINCPEGKEYNTELRKCVDIEIPEINCPEGKEYNTELRKCVDIDIFKVPEINCPEGKEYNTELGKCVDIDIDIPKISCGPGEFFDELTGDCEKLDLPDIEIDTPDVNIPDVDVDLPDIDLPDIDLPEVSVPSAPSMPQTMFEGMTPFGINYTRTEPLAIAGTETEVDYSQELNNLIFRQVQKRMFT
jgi:hypothetical protein